MSNINIITGEDLDKEWTKFLDTFSWDEPGTVQEINNRFEWRRNAWLKRMSKTYAVDIDDLKARYIH